MGNDLLAETVELVKRHGIKKISGHVMIGLPFENTGLFLDTVRLFRRLKISPIKFIYSPLPGTSLGTICREKGWLSQEAYYCDRIQAVIDYPTFSADEIQLCFDVFSILLRFPFLPLKLPGIPTNYLFRLYKFIFSFALFVEHRFFAADGPNHAAKAYLRAKPA